MCICWAPTLRLSIKFTRKSRMAGKLTLPMLFDPSIRKIRSADSWALKKEMQKVKALKWVITCSCTVFCHVSWKTSKKHENEKTKHIFTEEVTFLPLSSAFWLNTSFQPRHLLSRAGQNLSSWLLSNGSQCFWGENSAKCNFWKSRSTPPLLSPV